MHFIANYLSRILSVVCLVSVLTVFSGCGGSGGKQRANAESMPHSINNLKMIMLANHNHHDSRKRFPAAYSVDQDGKPLLSWRVHLLPYLEQKALYDQFHLDEPWDSDHNRKLIEQMPDVYRAPASDADPGKTVYRGLGGLGGMFRVPASSDAGSGNKIASVLDGTANTIMVVETSDALATEWTKPGVLAPGNFDMSQLFGTYPGGTNAAFVDGSVHFVPEATSPKMFSLLCTRNDGTNLSDWIGNVAAMDAKRQKDPQAIAKQFQQEADELKKSYDSSSKVEINQLKLGIATEKLKKLESALILQVNTVRNAQLTVTAYEQKYKTDASAEIGNALKAKTAALKSEQDKLDQLEQQKKTLKAQQETAGRELAEAMDKTFK